MRHAVERALARAMRRARCAPLPVIAVAATAAMLPSGAVPPLLADQPAARQLHRPVVQAPDPSAVALSPLTSRMLEVRRADRSVRAPHALPRRAAQKAARLSLPTHAWVRPAHGPLTSPYGYRWGRLHAGIDIGASYGSPIYAATDGVIEYAGPMSGYGQVMIIRDWDGTETAYGHMSAFVRRSGSVHAGDVIARVGSEGDATGPHLHFEVRVGGTPIDPRPFLAKRGIFY